MTSTIINLFTTGFPDDISNKRQLLRACVAEFLAMVLFVFLGTGSVAATGEFLRDGSGQSLKSNVSRLLPIATCFGLSITVLAFNFGAISGGHINPAVTFALMLDKKISPAKAGCYMVCQFLGAVFGSLLLWGGISGVSWNPPVGMNTTGFVPGVTLIPAVGFPPYGLGANTMDPLITPANGLLLETMGTMILILTVIMTAVDGRSMGQNATLAPIPIGFSVWLIHLVLVPWTGCGINPARTFGPMLVNLLGGEATLGTTWWIYYLGPLFGSTIGTLIAKFLRDEGCDAGNNRTDSAVVEEQQSIAYQGTKQSEDAQKYQPATTVPPPPVQFNRDNAEDFDQVYTI